MLDDDLFGVPPYYKTVGVTCEYGTHKDHYLLIASRDIQPEEELCIHYGAHNTGTSLIASLHWKCGSSNCVKILKFHFWRDPFFSR